MQPSQTHNQGNGLGSSTGGAIAGSSSGTRLERGGENSGENSPGSVISYGSTNQSRGMSSGPGTSAMQPGLIRKVKQSTSDRSMSTLFGCICDPFGTFSSSRDEDKEEEGTDHTQFVSGSVIGENNPNNHNPNNHINHSNNYNSNHNRNSR